MPRCTFFARGRCTKGAACSYSHDPIGPAEAALRGALHTSMLANNRTVMIPSALEPAGPILAGTEGAKVLDVRGRPRSCTFSNTGR